MNPPRPPRLPPVNLDVLKEQIAQQERVAADITAHNEMGIVVLSKDYELIVAQLPTDFQEANRGHTIESALSIEALNLPDYLRLQSAHIMKLDDPLLLITSRFQLLLISLRELLTYQESGLDLRDVHSFERNEQVCTLGNWRALATKQSLMLVSSQGIARAFEMRLLRPQIEGATPTRIGWTQAGWPRLVLAGDADDDLVLVNNAGRVARMPLKTVPRVGAKVLPKQKSDDIIGGACMTEGAILLVAVDGTGAQVPIRAIPASQGRSGQGHAVVRRRGLISGIVVVDEAKQAWALTSMRLVPLQADMAQRDDGPDHEVAAGELRRMTRLLPLDDDEDITGILAVT